LAVLNAAEKKGESKTLSDRRAEKLRSKAEAFSKGVTAERWPSRFT